MIIFFLLTLAVCYLKLGAVLRSVYTIDDAVWFEKLLKGELLLFLWKRM